MILILGSFMSILDSSIVNVALPKLMSIFGVSADDIQWVMTAYLLTSGVVVPMTGYLSDRYGGKRLYIASLIVFTVGSGLCALAWSNNSLIFARVLQALGGGMVIPISMAMMFNLVPREKMGMAMGVWGISAMVAPAIGPTLGGYLVDNFGWPWIFTINIPIGLFAVFMSGVLLTETPRRTDLKPDIFGSILVAIACFTVLLALSQGQDEGWTSLYIVNLIIISVFTFVLFVIWELNTPEPLIDLRLLKNRTFTLSLVATALASISMFGIIFLIPMFLQSIRGLTPMQSGFAIMPMALTTAVMMPISGRLFDKVGAMPLCLIGFSIAAYYTYELHYLSYSMSISDIEWILVKRAVGLGLAMMPVGTAGMNTIPRFLAARASSLNNLVRQISASMGIAFVTYMFLHRQVFQMAWMKETVTWSSPASLSAISKIKAAMVAYGTSPATAAQGAKAALGMVISRESLIAGINDAMVISTLIAITIIPLSFFFSKKTVQDETKKQYEVFAGMMPNGNNAGGPPPVHAE
ncbi:MAG: DHA2 family efflux MFS transporter permease subunit [Firmicutes bacterium]|nr:DHA2 family efflux MFS transporter permease subunit [Bacillota bacterium]